MIRCPQCSKLVVRDVTRCECGHAFDGKEPDATPTQRDVSEWQQTSSAKTSNLAPSGSLVMPIISAFISTLLLLGMAVEVHNKLQIRKALPWDERFWTIFATILAVTAALSGWLYVATSRIVAGRVHGVIMVGIGCFGLHEGFYILTNHSIAGGRGPDANPMAGVVYGIGFLGAVVGALVLLCGVLVFWKTFNASRRNHNDA